MILKICKTLNGFKKKTYTTPIIKVKVKAINILDKNNMLAWYERNSQIKKEQGCFSKWIKMINQLLCSN